MDYIIGLDTDLFLWLNSSHAPFWDFFMKVLTGKLIWIGLYLSILYALWRAYGLKVMVTVLLGCMLAVLLADQFTASMLRPWVGRLRPAHPESPISDIVHIVDGYRGGTYSFPSSHAANTFAVATLLSMVFRQLRFSIAIFIWAMINCYSRIHLGVHYPGDLIVGSVIGVTIGFAFYFIVSLVFRQIRFSPSRIGMKPVGEWKTGRLTIVWYPTDYVVAMEFLTIAGVSIAYLILL